MLKRFTPLRRGASRLTPSPLAKVSARQKKINASFRKARAAAFDASGGRCVWPGCARAAEHGHHQLGRGVGGNHPDRLVCLPLCREHHELCKEDVKLAKSLGMVVQRRDNDPMTPARVIRGSGGRERAA